MLSSDWKYRSIIRRDFRHTHDGPEVPAWRKKAKKHDKTKCEHVFGDWTERSYPSWANGREKEKEYGFFLENITSQYRSRKCKFCKKSEWQHRQLVEHIWYDKNHKIMNRDSFTTFSKWGGRWVD